MMSIRIDKVASAVDIAVSGLRAEAMRMDVISSNIANSQTAAAGNGQPYRRKDLVFSTLMDEISGVTIDGVRDDPTAFKIVYDPGHPNAAPNGYVQMPNVDVPIEMMHLVSASRAYQANAAVLKRFQDNIDTTLELLR
jgi:flagellar basal-body rod protein FlgC